MTSFARAAAAFDRWRHKGPLVSVLRFDGVIGGRGQRAISVRRHAHALERAFRSGVAGVALVLNSPGGSAAQSALLHRRIRQLADERRVPVFAFAEDVAASGAYWLALAADEIYAEETSLVGSIGVISASFGLQALIERWGIERRLHTAGENKSLMDPFLPARPHDVERLTALQRDLHDSFKALVRARRGARLKGEESALLSGEVFTGRSALAAGLIDGIGDARGVLRTRFGERVRFRAIEPERRRFPIALRRPRIPDVADLTADLVGWLEERALWSRFGL